MGLIYRSGQLCTLNPTELAEIDSLGLTQVIDLRSNVEAARCPDPPIPGAPYQLISVFDETNPLLTLFGATTPAEMRAAYDSLGGPDGNQKSGWIEFTLPEATVQFRTLFQEILAANGAPIFIHDSGGQDRMGFPMYVLLRILGVPERIALEDYLLSATLNQGVYAQQLVKFEALGYNESEALAGMQARPELVKIALDQMNIIFGGFDNYVREGLGLTSADITQLQATYVDMNV